MAFPNYSVLDNFTRADVGPPPSDAWSGVIESGNAGMKVISNVLAPNGAQASACLSAVLDANQEAFATIPTLPDIGDNIRIWINITNPGTASVCGYLFQIWRHSAGSGNFDIYRLDNGAYTNIATLSNTLVAGDVIGVKNDNGTIRVYRNGTEVNSIADSTYLQKGQVGVGFYGTATTGRFDDFGCGPFVLSVAGVTEGGLTSAGTSLAVTLPSGGSASDEYIVVIAKGSVSCTINALTGWTELLDEAVAAGLAIIRYTGAGVPGNPTFVQSVASRSVWCAYRIIQANKTIAPEVGTTATGTSTTPNPPSRAVTGGPKDILAIACFAAGASELADDDTLVTTFPTNYTYGQVEKTGGITGTNLAGLLGVAARRVVAASTEDPGTFLQNASRAWRANTIVVHPAIAAPASVDKFFPFI